MDNFEMFVQAARIQSELDAKYRKRTREERKRKVRRIRFIFWLLSLALATAVVFCAMSRLYPEAQAAWEEAIPQSTAEPLGAEYAENPEEEMLIEQALLNKATKIENCRVTYYCAEPYEHICGYGLGITATGAECVPYAMVAVDKNVIPLHSQVLVDFGDGRIECYVAEDVGGGIKGNHIDIMVATHEEALSLGSHTADVYWVLEDE